MPLYDLRDDLPSDDPGWFERTIKGRRESWPTVIFGLLFVSAIVLSALAGVAVSLAIIALVGDLLGIWDVVTWL